MLWTRVYYVFFGFISRISSQPLRATILKLWQRLLCSVHALLHFVISATGSYVSVSDLSEATNGRIAQLQNGTLLLSYVDDSDPREFLCFLKPGRISTAAQRSSAVNLEVHGKFLRISLVAFYSNKLSFFAAHLMPGWNRRDIHPNRWGNCTEAED